MLLWLVACLFIFPHYFFIQEYFKVFIIRQISFKDNNTFGIFFFAGDEIDALPAPFGVLGIVSISFIKNGYVPFFQQQIV
jgi:hypothetical protein